MVKSAKQEARHQQKFLVGILWQFFNFWGERMNIDDFIKTNFLTP